MGTYNLDIKPITTKFFNFLKRKKINMPRGGGLPQPYKVSDEMAAIIGRKVASRAECVKYMWEYLKKHNLQDPENKQYFNPDKKMAKVVGTDRMRGFGMSKFIGAHLKIPVNEDKENKDDNEEEEEEEESDDE